ncbi:recombinase family protein [Rhizobium leguminosarum]|uniref:recombinase family protein n=1 Tax=Rhizobium leguminosarum TaxID=384 RepID=UPI003F9AE2E3
MKPKAYSYVRMSTDLQLKGDSLRRQTEESKRYCEENGLELVEDFTLQDIGVSAYHGKNVAQGALGRFLAHAQKGSIPEGSFLIVESLDRISREKAEAAIALFLQILQSGINLVTLSDGRIYKSGSTNFIDIVYSVFIMARAHEESQTKSLRVGAAWENKRRNIHEKKLTQVAPAWLRLSEDRKTYDVIPERIAVLRTIFNDADNGKGSFQIARKLNLDGVPTFAPSKGWHESYVTKILTSRAVLGEYQPHRYIDGKRTPAGDPVKDYFPAVISREQFYRILAGRVSRKNRGSGRKGRNNINLFSSIATCGYCHGKMMIVDKGTGPKGGVYLRCDNARRGNECEAGLWPLKHLETAFLSFVKEIDLRSLIIESSEREARLSLEGQLASVSNELAKKRKIRDGAFELMSDDAVDMTYVRQRLADLAINIKELEDSLAELSAQENLRLARQSDRTLNERTLVEAIASGPKDNLDSRTVVADWIRRNVEQLQVYPDGFDGPPGAVAKMRETMDPDIIAILDTAIAFAEQRSALVDGSNRRFEISFGGHKFRAVEVDRTDPTKLIVSSYADEHDWGMERGR